MFVPHVRLVGVQTRESFLTIATFVAVLLRGHAERCGGKCEDAVGLYEVGLGCWCGDFGGVICKL